MSSRCDVAWGGTMKKLSLVSVSILALSMGAQSLFAAEVEVPPSPERAAPTPAPAREEAAPPARERAAPARERAAPARERAAPRRAAQNQTNRAASNSQASNTSWTGNQAGGFGGGNASAGGFADPVIHACATQVFAGGFRGSLACICSGFFILFAAGCRSRSVTPKAVSQAARSSGAMCRSAIWSYGVEGDIAGKSGESSYVQPTTTTVAYGPTPSGGYFSGFSTPTATRTDLISGSIRQGTDGSIRPRIGYLVTPVDTGVSHRRHCLQSCQRFVQLSLHCHVHEPCSSCRLQSPQVAVDTLAGSGSVDKTLTGGTIGGGVEFVIAYGLKARFEYRWSGFGGLSFDVPLPERAPASAARLLWRLQLPPARTSIWEISRSIRSGPD